MASLIANILLLAQWQSDRQGFRNLLDSQDQTLTIFQRATKKLSQENETYEQEIISRDRELAELVENLKKKQTELTNVGEQLKSKQDELVVAQNQIDSQKAQLTANADELAKLRTRPPLFSFQVKSNTLANAEAKKEAVKRLVTAAYDVVEEFYGKAYLLHSVTISFVDSFTNTKASGEIIIINSDKGLDVEIRIKDFDSDNFNDVNTIIHEVIHSFHGLASPESPAFEEGITVAATDAVMAKLRSDDEIADFSQLYLRLSESQFKNFQNTLSIPGDSRAFYGSEQVADFYQVLGQAWYNLYLADNDFFKKFNERIYSVKQAGQGITNQLVLDTVRAVAPGADLSGAAWNLK